MKKMITAGLMVLMLGTGGVMKAYGPNVTYYDVTDEQSYDDQNKTSYGSGIVKVAAIAVGAVAAVYGMDYALSWATKIGLPSTILGYEFGTLCNQAKEIMQKMIAFSPQLLAYLKTLPEKVKSIPQLINEIPTLIKNILVRMQEMNMYEAFVKHLQNIGGHIKAMPGYLKALPTLLISYPKSVYDTYQTGKKAQNSFCWKVCSYFPLCNWF